VSIIERIELYLHLIECEDPPSVVHSREQEAHELLVDSQFEIERLRVLLPDPRELSGWDDPFCEPCTARYLVAVAESQGIEVPKHLRDAAKVGDCDAK
jgi:hypothetical protein